MGLFVLDLSDKPTPLSLMKVALANLDLYSDYCSVGPGTGRFKDEFGQTPPDYLVTGFAMDYLRKAIALSEEST